MRRCFLAAMVSVLAAGSGAVEYHVAPSGDDGGEGTEAAPFATLPAARDAIRALKQSEGLPEGGVTVWVHEGAYEAEETFTLTEEDSGEAARRIVYRAMLETMVRLVGGRELPADRFAPLGKDAVRERMDRAAGKEVLWIDLREFGMTDLGTYPERAGEPPVIPELFFDDQRMTLARWPNEGWAEIAKVIESGPAPWRKHESDGMGTFEYEGDRPARWLNAPGVWLHGYWCFDWRSETLQVKSIAPEKRHITLLHNHGYGLGSGNPAARRYHAVNLLEELDSPCEYYIDRVDGRLYFWPPKPIKAGRTILSTLKDPVVFLDGVSHVTLCGFTVEACAGLGIRMNGGEANEIAACTIRNTGLDAVVVDGGERHRVVACNIYDTGQGGIRISGGDRRTLTPCGHEVINNHIHHVSRRQRTGAYHVRLRGVGIRLAHNLLHDGPHQAIGLGGNDHVIELNEIHHTGMETDDCGSFYMGRNPSERGSVIRHNFWHDIGGSFSHGSTAVYFDDGSGGQRVFGNVFCRAAGGSFGAVFMHGGHGNTVDNNIFVDCKLALGQAPWTDGRWMEQVNGALWQRVLLEDVDITKPPYSERYPDLEGFFDPPEGPRLNHAYRNLLFECGDFVRGNWVIADNWVANTEPGFVEREKDNYALREGSAAYKRIPGFQPIPFGEIGLYEDELRPDLPEE